MFKKLYPSMVLAVFLTACLVLVASNVTAQQLFEKKLVRQPVAKPNEILVKFKPGVGVGEINKINQQRGILAVRLGLSGVLRLKVPQGKRLEDVLAAYKGEQAVAYAEPNYIATAFMTPNDPYYEPYQWHLDNAAYGGIEMEEAWDIQTGDLSVIVAVVDTGVAYENYGEYYLAPDLANATFVPGYDFVESDTHPNDDNSHGTHVAGTIAQSTNNEMGCAGVAFNTAIMPVKVLDGNGSGTYADVADGIIWATDHGAKVINLSLGGSSPSDTLKDAVAYAYNHGVTVIASSGNDGAETVNYPAAYDAYVIAVGATRYDEAVAYYSSYYSDTIYPVIGQYVDLAAPGGDLYVDQNGDGYGDGVLQNTFNPYTKMTNDFGYWFFEGTSMAAPHVSGVAALLISEGVAITPAEVREALQSTAEDKGPEGWDPKYGWGIVDAYAALNPTPNNPPVADDQAVTTAEDTAVAITLTGSDVDGDTLTYTVLTNPTNGSLSGTAPNLTYTPNLNFNGSDSFTFKVNDGTVDSNVATVSIEVTPVNDTPVANPQSIETTQDTAVAITLTGGDVDNDPITFNQPTAPANGTLTLDANYTTNGKLTYTPHSGFTGSDSFTFTVNDGTVDSEPATVSIVTVKKQVTGEGFILSKNPDFSTDDREFAISDALYIKVFSEFIDFENLNKNEYKIEDANRQKTQGKLTNHFDGTYTTSLSLSNFALGTAKVNIKLEDRSKKKFEVKNELITIVEAPDTEPPTVPTNLSATAVSENQINLTWTASTDNVGVAGYNIFRGASQVGTSDATSFSDTGLEPSTSYEYQVRAFDAAGNLSDFSGSASATTLAPDTEAPTTPTGLTATAVSGTQINLSWNASSDNRGVVGYNIFRDGDKVGTSDTTSFSDTGLQPSTTYEYQVQAFDAAENTSELSGPASATTLDQITGEGFILSKNADFSTDDREFATTDYMYMKVFSEFIDPDKVKKAQWELKVNKTRLKGSLMNNRDGTFTADVSLAQFSAGDAGTVQLKVEANKRLEFKDIRITITDGGLGDGWSFVLGQNRPNPFNPDTWIPFALDKDCKVTIKIYNVTGKLVRTLDFGHLNAGVYVDKGKAAYWGGRNANGERVSSGIYFYLMEAGKFRAMKKMVIMK